MATSATVVLDSGVFLSNLPKSDRWDVGYFESGMSIPNIRVYADGTESSIAPPLYVPSDKSTLEVQHIGADGQIKKGVLVDQWIKTNRLTWDKLYGQNKEIDETKFDCVVRFHSGYFRPSMIKARRFKFDPPSSTPPLLVPSVAHNVVVHYTLEDREVLTLAKGNQVLWTSNSLGTSPELLELEFVADHATAEGFYRTCLKAHTGGHWLPNQGDPPPIWPPDK